MMQLSLVGKFNVKTCVVSLGLGFKAVLEMADGVQKLGLK
jgi:hypothetical protein